MSCHVSSCHVMSVQIQFVSCFISFTYLPCNSISKSNFVLPWNTKNKSYHNFRFETAIQYIASSGNYLPLFFTSWLVNLYLHFVSTRSFTSDSLSILPMLRNILYIFRKWICGRINEVVVKWGFTVLGNWFQGLPLVIEILLQGLVSEKAVITIVTSLAELQNQQHEMSR